MQVIFLIHIKEITNNLCFPIQGATIFWKATKHSLAATSSNHSEIIALHEVSCECVWLRPVDGFIKGSYDFSNVPESPTMIYEDNATCIAKIKANYIKKD